MSNSGENDFRSRWRIDPEIAFLNHGSFGACPISVLEEQVALLRELESEPLDFLSRNFEDRLNRSRTCLSGFLKANPDGLVFVRNATEGLNVALRSIPLNPGDEVLLSDHEYNATRNIVHFVCKATGAVPRIVHVPFPDTTTDAILTAFRNGFTNKTKILVADHCSSQTALVFPVDKLCEEATKRGVVSVIDGAHAPGMIPLALDALDANFYVGNCHKWMCAPKGVGFVYVKDALRRESVMPLIVSHGANDLRLGKSQFLKHFDWVGTHDYSAALSVPSALGFIGSLYPGGVAELMERNHQKAVQGRDIICEALSLVPPCDSSLNGSMVSFPFGSGDPVAVMAYLRQSHQVEMLVAHFPATPSLVIRLSAQAYVSINDFKRAASALVSAIDEGIIMPV